MQPPNAQIDMAAIREALARRQGGGGTPALDQMAGPGGSLPGGGPNVPIPTPVPSPPTGSLPPAQAPLGAVANQPSKLKQVANFDDETKSLAKQLITKLMSTL